jgi:hypothetical protein
MKRPLACTIFAAALAAALAPAGAQQPTPATRSYSPNPRNVNVGPSARPNSRGGPHNRSTQQHGHGTYGSNPYQAQPYVNIDSATMRQILATPKPSPKPSRAAPHATPTVFWQINSRP